MADSNIVSSGLASKAATRPASQDLSGHLARLRTRLLDLTLANRLLNYRHTKRGSLRVVDELPDVLWSRLRDGDELLYIPVPEPALGRNATRENRNGEIAPPSSEPRAKTRRGAKEHAESLGIATDFELPAPSGSTKNSHRDKQIQTLLYPDDLEGSLRSICTSARSCIEETGTNMLYLMFGFLEWYESDSSEEAHLAPLLVLPVTVRKDKVDPKTRTFRYLVTYSGEDISANDSLIEKLKRDFGLLLPGVEDDELPEQYYQRVSRAIKPLERWRVRRQVSLGLLSFGKLLMYRDLDPEHWPEGNSLLEHDRVAELFEGVDRPPAHAGEYYLDAPELSATLPPLVLDADSSQHSAIVDAMAGKSMVIEGPPGTGKSQTIANLIAAALSRGKTVLFVAEKLAALEVVRRRLDNVGLGEFCLELHSHKTRKQELLSEIRQRLESRGKHRDAHGFEQQQALVAEARTTLAQYDALLHRPFGEVGWPVYRIFWARERARTSMGRLADQLSGEVLAEAERWTLNDVERRRSVASRISRQLRAIQAAVDEAGFKPWLGVTKPLTAAEQGEAIARLEHLHHASVDLVDAVAAVETATGAPFSPTHEAALIWLGVAPNLDRWSSVARPDWIPMLVPEHTATSVKAFCTKHTEVRSAIDALRNAVDEPSALAANAVADAESALDAASHLLSSCASVAELGQRITDLELTSTWLTWGNALRSQVSATIGTEVPDVMGAVPGCLEAVALAQVAPLGITKFRSPEAHDDGAEHAFQRAWTEARTVLEEQAAIEQRATVAMLPDTQQLSEHLSACAGAGIFAFLSSRYRAAKRCHALLSKASSSATRAQLVTDFRDFLTFSKRRQSFGSSAEFSEAVGPAFRGLETPFSDIAATREWQRLVRRTLRPFGPPAPALTLALERGSGDCIHALADVLPGAASYRQSIARAVREAMDCLKRQGTPPTAEGAASIGATQDAATRAAALLRDVSRTLAALGVKPTTSLTGAREALALWRRTQDEIAFLAGNMEARRVLGDDYIGVQTPIEPLREASEVRDLISQSALPNGARDWLTQGDFAGRVRTLAALLSGVGRFSNTIEHALARFTAYVGLDESAWWGGASRWGQCLSAKDVVARSETALRARVHLQPWCDYLATRIEAISLGLGGLVRLGEGGEAGQETLSAACDLTVYNSLAASALRAHPDLTALDWASHDDLRDRFRRYDVEVIRAQHERAAFLIDQRAVPPGVGTGPVAEHTDLALLERESRKQRRHIPIRQLLLRSAAALQGLKPCFMMGPRAVAQYLAPGKLKFDIVIMDEASQLPPEDALGAIGRANQVVIVGDHNQLPPTTFFDRALETDELEEDASAMVEAESILDVARAGYPIVRRLRWHYRSKHDSLIAFSNREFYENSLIVFPSPRVAGDDVGVKFVYIPNAVYAAGQNDIEAARVVDAMVDHLRNRPQESLGVATMNFKQRDLIEGEFDRRLKADPDLVELYEQANAAQEPLFIKNLENVQGDERDVILVSVTYGRDARGNLYHRFGPVNGAMGWRRLNVLFTRARRKLVVFCSFDPDDLVVDGTTQRGVGVLKRYLSFAKTGHLEGGAQSGREPDSDFEVAVASALRSHGFDVAPQVGVAGYFIDMAVKHPAKPGAFILGIECDGATYHSSFSARDRDRLRQEALESFGWQIHRIWSTDWFRHPERETERVVARIRGLIAGRDVAAGNGAKG